MDGREVFPASAQGRRKQVRKAEKELQTTHDNTVT